MGSRDKTYSLDEFRIRTDAGREVVYKIDPMEIDEAFGLARRFLPVLGVGLSAMEVLRDFSQNDALRGMVTRWMAEGSDETKDPGERLASIMDDDLFELLAIIGSLGSVSLASIPAKIAAWIASEGDGALLQRILGSCHRYDPVSGEGGWLSEKDLYRKVFKRNIGEALRACWVVLKYNFVPLVAMGNALGGLLQFLKLSEAATHSPKDEQQRPSLRDTSKRTAGATSTG